MLRSADGWFHALFPSHVRNRHHNPQNNNNNNNNTNSQQNTLSVTQHKPIEGEYPTHHCGLPFTGAGQLSNCACNHQRHTLMRPRLSANHRKNAVCARFGALGSLAYARGVRHCGTSTHPLSAHEAEKRNSATAPMSQEITHTAFLLALPPSPSSSDGGW